MTGWFFYPEQTVSADKGAQLLKSDLNPKPAWFAEVSGNRSGHRRPTAGETCVPNHFGGGPVPTVEKRCRHNSHVQRALKLT